MDQTAAGRRFSVWLRGERAFGLDAVSLPPPQPAPPPKDAAELPSAPTTGAGDLFGSASPPPMAAVAEPVLSTQQKIATLAALDIDQVRPCQRCALCKFRKQTVFGEGSSDAQIFFIGEGPGENEDLQGRPFVGRAGELLNKMIAGMGLKREQVYIANIVKCRPPNNRTPGPDEVAACTPYLVRQLEIVRPRVIVTLGLPAARYMLNLNQTMGQMRGQWHKWREIPLMPTYHPAYLLRSYTPANRQAVWSDLQKVMAEVGLPIPPRGG
jgi:uracil-DNA glycosylase family 4